MYAPHFEIQNGVLTKCRMSGKENLTVTIPDGVTSIGKEAFFDCGLLQSITIPDSVTSIGKEAFWGCDALKSITIPDSVISIGDKVFAGCTALENITIPNGVINIGNYVFAGCNSLQSINVSEGNSHYLSCGGVLFDKSKSELIKYPEGKKDLYFTIPDGVTIVEKYAFSWSKSLKSIKFPDSITSIRCKAFDRCTSLKNIDVSESNTSYSSCNGILFDKAKKTLIKYPEGKKDTSYIIPDGVTSIGDFAFMYCTSLKSITIPNSVTSVGCDAFRWCTLLESIDFLSKKMKTNEGEVPQYYIENSHEAIIDPMEWEAVQDEFKRRKSRGRAYSGKSVFGAKIVCGDCGGFYGSKTWHSTDKYKTVIWQCNRKFKNNTCCKTPHITEDEIKKRFLKVYNGLISDKEPFIKACKLTRDVLTDTEEIDREMSELLRELEVVTELIKKCIAENSSSAQDQEKYTERYNNYVDRYEKAKSRYDELKQKRENKLSKRKAIDRFVSDLSKRDELLTEFDNCLWLTVVDTVTVQSDGILLFRFNDVTEIKG